MRLPLHLVAALAAAAWLSPPLVASADAATEPGVGPPPGVGRPPKISFRPQRVENAHVAGGVISVEVTADSEVVGATLWLTPSLDGLIEAPTGPIDIPASGPPTVVELKVLKTPDAAGRSIGGTVHVILNGRHLAQPLTVSLLQSSDVVGGEPPDEDAETEPLIDPNGRLPVSWADAAGPIEQLTLEMFDGAFAELRLTANRDLANVELWPTPSLRPHIRVSIDPAAPQEPGVFERSADGSVIVFLKAGTTIPILVELLKPADQPPATIGGTIHVKNLGVPPRTWPQVLNVQIGEEAELAAEVAPAAIVGAAAFDRGAIAPGQVVSIFGSSVGPRDLAVFQLNSEGKVDRVLNGAMVLFDGYPAPILSASATQLNVIVPNAVKQGAVELLVVNNGKQSAPFPVPVGPVAPGLFSLNGTGRGQAAALNSDGSVNSDRNPSRGGTVMTLFGTGAGPLVEPVEEGAIAKAAIRLAKPVRVAVGGVEADVLYAGAAPGLVGAVVQLNIRTNGLTPKGPQSVVVGVDGIESPPTVTVAIE